MFTFFTSEEAVKAFVSCVPWILAAHLPVLLFWVPFSRILYVVTVLCAIKAGLIIYVYAGTVVPFTDLSSVVVVMIRLLPWLFGFIVVFGALYMSEEARR